MNANLLNIVRRIVTGYGEGILADPQRLKPLFSDYAKNEQKEERAAFGRCIEAGAYYELKKTRTADERRRVKSALADQVCGKTGIYRAQCNDALDLLEAVIFNQAQQTPPSTQYVPQTQTNMPYNVQTGNIRSAKKGHTKAIQLIAGTVLLAVLVIVLIKILPPILDRERAGKFYNIGVSYYNNEDYDNAITQFTEAIGLNPDYVRAYALRGESYRMKGQYDMAIKDLDDALRLDPDFRLNPDYGWVYMSRGESYRMKGQYDMAIKDLDEALRLDPDNARAYDSRARAYLLKEQYSMAVKDFNDTLRLDPNNAAAYANRGIAYVNLGQRNQAIQDLENALILDPTLDGIKQLIEELKYQEVLQEFWRGRLLRELWGY